MVPIYSMLAAVSHHFLLYSCYRSCLTHSDRVRCTLSEDVAPRGARRQGMISRGSAPTVRRRIYSSDRPQIYA